MDKETAINKIRKCLALAGSSEPHEAAAALRQAQKLMLQHGIDHPELLAAGIGEEWAKASASKTPPKYEAQLAWIIGQAFNCEPIFSPRVNKARTALTGGYVFVGAQPAPEVASYTFEVLRAKLTRARSSYMDVALKRYRKNKTAAADKFCEGWVRAVYSLVDIAEPTQEHTEALSVYIKRRGGTTTLATKSRELSTGSAGEGHKFVGYREGQKVELHQGVGVDKYAVAGLLT
jgi:hypothetical protein